MVVFDQVDAVKMPHAVEINDKESATIPHQAVASLDDDTLGPTMTTEEDCGDAIFGAQDVQAQLHYLSPGLDFSKNKPPVQVVARESTARDPRTTVRLSQGPPETIHDVRGREHEFTLENNGFKYVRSRPRFQDWDSRDGIWTEYIEELKELVAQEFGGAEGGVDEVIAFHEGVSISSPCVCLLLTIHLDRNEARTRNGDKQQMGRGRIHSHVRFMSTSPSRPSGRS